MSPAQSASENALTKFDSDLLIIKPISGEFLM